MPITIDCIPYFGFSHTCFAAGYEQDCHHESNFGADRVLLDKSARCSPVPGTQAQRRSGASEGATTCHP